MMLQTWLPLLVAILVVGSAVTQGQQCGQNENYTTCGTACPLTCQRPVPTICTYQCVRGCFCNDGFVRSDKGNCIRPSECKLQDEQKKAMLRTILPLLVVILVVGPKITQGYRCGENEMYSSCGTACPLTCQRPQPGICTLQCVMGCFCKQGFVRSNSGKCVRLSDC
ncbi:serine protease inhibitor swm-1-like [Hermetia illucens]|uniref:serine protease inhibitor swm-1-like n=1 Tax=Hermetia illucens TaxID=343691 RepID=UPI0018CC1867|nr:serine protease inhibitor swm-1-like [Hermetia illucens]